MTYSDTQIDKPGSNSAEFVSIALLEGVKAGRGTGFSKKESQQNAAKEALINMRASQTFYESIFHAKEQRTAMEESEICVLPRIQEIEDAVQQRFTRHIDYFDNNPVVSSAIDFMLKVVSHYRRKALNGISCEDVNIF